VIVSDQTVLVTGGASGIGHQFVRHLAAAGARVWAVDNDTAALCAAREGTPGAQFVHCDVGDEDQVVRTVADIERTSDGITVLVNNAAVLRDQALVSRVGRRIKKHSLADWQATLQSNLTGTFLMAREVAEAMIRARRPGLIVNMSSVSRHGNAGQTAYSATKAAIDALTTTWSRELTVYGIRVAAIAPGFVETPMTRRIPPLFLDRIREQTPLKRFGTLDEFGRAIQFVIENDYFNGKVLELDGGLRF
jgi:3-oxoacyl-[acyl-carrier protein] reductase